MTEMGVSVLGVLSSCDRVRPYHHIAAATAEVICRRYQP